MNSLFHFHQRLDLKYEQARVSSPALNASTCNKKVKRGLCEFNDRGYKCVSAVAHPVDREASGHPCRLFSFSLNVSMAAQPWLQPAFPLLCCHLMPSSPWGATSKRWSIRNEEKLLEWKYLAWLPAGQSLFSSWPSSSWQYPIQQFSRMLCLRAFWAPTG